MSNEILSSEMETSLAAMVYRKDYTPSAYLIDSVDLDIVLNESDACVSSHIQFTRRALDEASPLVLNGEGLILESIQLNGQLLSGAEYQLTDQTLTIFSVPHSFVLDIVVRIFPHQNEALSGLYRSKTMYCTQCEAEGFRRITYFLDRPDVLTAYTTKITANRARYPTLLSNGNLVAQGELPHGRHWVKWVDPFKKPSYLFALVAGDFDLLEDRFTTQSEREIALKLYVEKGYLHQANHAMQSLKDAMLWDEKTYGREYDLDIYMIVAINDFNMGAMENKGLNIFNTKYILAQPSTATDEDYLHVETVVAHEYFHNWTGNRVTCRDWFQLSLKEGLTIFREHHFAEDIFSRAVMRIRDVRYLREVQFAEDSGPLAHAVRPDAYIEINNFYTTTIYEKGAEVLRMLQTMLGVSLFRQGMDLYFRTFDGQAVTIEDYVHTMELVSGMDLTQFRLWYSQAGTPHVYVSNVYDAVSQKYTMTLRQETQSTPDQPEKQPFYIPIQMGLLDDNGQTIAEKILALTQSTQTFVFEKIATKPIPSLLRNFSAPVKLHYDYSVDELVFLFKYDQDPFNRWEAGQQYFTRTLLAMVEDYQQQRTLQLPDKVVEMFEYVIKDASREGNSNGDDLCFVSEMLSLPSEKYLAEQMTIIDVDAIHAAREFVLQGIAVQLEKILLEHYHRLHHPFAQYVFNMKAMGERQFKNTCLAYLMRLPQHAALGMKQFEDALDNNMTDTQVALTSLVELESPLRDAALD